MRIVEVLVNKVTEDGDEQSDALLSILDHLVHKADDSTEHGESKISFATIIQLMRNLRQPIDYDEFKQLYDMNPAISNLVRNFDDEFITLNTDEELEVDMSDPQNIEQPSQNTVDHMAKRALKKRI